MLFLGCHFLQILKDGYRNIKLYVGIELSVEDKELSKEKMCVLLEKDFIFSIAFYFLVSCI